MFGYWWERKMYDARKMGGVSVTQFLSQKKTVTFWSMKGTRTWEEDNVTRNGTELFVFGTFRPPLKFGEDKKTSVWLTTRKRDADTRAWHNYWSAGSFRRWDLPPIQANDEKFYDARAVGWGTALKSGGSRVRFPNGSDIFHWLLPAAIQPRGRVIL